MWIEPEARGDHREPVARARVNWESENAVLEVLYGAQLKAAPLFSLSLVNCLLVLG